MLTCPAWTEQVKSTPWSMALVRWFRDRSNNRQIPNIRRQSSQHSQRLICHTRISLSIMCWLWLAWIKRHENRMDIQRRGQFQCHHKGVMIFTNLIQTNVPRRQFPPLSQKKAVADREPNLLGRFGRFRMQQWKWEPLFPHTRPGEHVDPELKELPPHPHWLEILGSGNPRTSWKVDIQYV